MRTAALKPRFVIDETGKKSSVLLTLSDYRRLLAAWEEVADAEDFIKAKETPNHFISMDELRCRLKRKSWKHKCV